MLADSSAMHFWAHRDTIFYDQWNVWPEVSRSEQCLWKQTDQVDIWHSVREWIQTLLSVGQNANLRCFKMLILRTTWQIQNQSQEEFCVFSEALRFFQAEVISMDAGFARRWNSCLIRWHCNWCGRATCTGQLCATPKEEATHVKEQR